MAAKVQTKIEKVTARAGIKRAFALLRQRGLSIRQFRADCGSYAEDIVQTVDDNSLLFYLRAADSQSMYAQIQRITEWKPAEINFQECEVASVMLEMQKKSVFLLHFAHLFVPFSFGEGGSTSEKSK